MQLLYKSSTRKLCQTFMIKQFLRIWNITSLLQGPLIQLAYCRSSNCHVSLRRRKDALSINCPIICTLFKSVEGRAKCPTVPQLREFVIGICAVRQGSK